MSAVNVINWTEDDVEEWSKREQINEFVYNACVRFEGLDGKSLLALTETDIQHFRMNTKGIRLGDLKHFWIAVRQLQKENHMNLISLGLIENSNSVSASGFISGCYHQPHTTSQAIHLPHHHCSGCSDISTMHDLERISPPLSIDGRASSIKPEVFKAAISLGECNRVREREREKYYFMITFL